LLLTGASAGWEDQAVEIEALDLLYVPSRDVEPDHDFYRRALGTPVGFAIEAMATRVTEVAISPQGPRLMLAEHLAGDAPVLLHRLSDIDETLAQLDAHASRLEGRVELPLGPRATFRSPGGERLALPAHATTGRRALPRPRRLLIGDSRSLETTALACDTRLGHNAASVA
jgi:hypothetical protein